MSDDEAPRHAQAPSRRRRWLKRIAIGTALLLVLLTGGAYAAYKHLEGNINGLDVDLGADRPTEVEVEGPTQPLTVLVMGTDSREGTNIGGDTPGLSDTTMLLHVSADRSRAYGVSIPRDLMVERPDCTGKNGAAVPGGLTQFNAAYALGGPACTVRTVEALTEGKVKIDHFVVVNLAGFKEMVDAVGGVTVCVPNEVNDTTGNIYLPEGTYEVKGNRALDYVRVRHGLGLANGDIGRMKRQQAFVASLVDEVMSAGTLTNPLKLYRFLDAATKSLTTDTAFADLGELTSLGSSLADIGTDNIRFVTVPNEPYVEDSNRLQLADGAQALFNKIRNDQPLGRFSADALVAGRSPGATPSDGGSPSASPGASPSGSPSASASPSEDAEAQREAAEERRRQAAEDAGLCV